MSVTQIYTIFCEKQSVSTDSRQITPGCIFFALKGPSFNGNEFASKALELGASFAVIDEEQYATDSRCILVDDVLKTLQQLATYHRHQLGIPVIGIVGSNGKTTTKELLAAVLQKKYNLLATPGNFNNHIGVPLTLLKLTAAHEIAVIEMGANHIGENAELCEIAAPDYGLITNIGKDHLEGFGSIEGVANASSELYAYLLKHGGTAFVNANDEWLMRMASRLSNKKTYAANYPGHTSEADYEGELTAARPFIRFTMDGFQKTFRSVLSGEYNFDNIMAAVAIGRYFGVAMEQIAAGLAGYEPKNNRSQILKKGNVTIYLDAYNANPSSMEVSLMNFAANDFPGKIAVLGDMYELGEFSDKEHQQMTMLATELGLEEVWLVGPSFAKHALIAGAKSFNDATEVKNYILQRDYSGKTFFLKGSRGMKLETIAEAFSA
jgi:UDP-N-acetylmuramoyl-tripeptide--D-alanyl-D-alanine ligase